MPRWAAAITSCGVRWVRAISRTDCWAKMGWSLPLRQAAMWPGVASPRRSPNPKEGSRPSKTGCGEVGFFIHRFQEFPLSFKLSITQTPRRLHGKSVGRIHADDNLNCLYTFERAIHLF